MLVLETGPRGVTSIPQGLLAECRSSLVVLMIVGVSGHSTILLYKVLQTGMSLGSSAQEMSQIREQIRTDCIIYEAEDSWRH